MGEIMSLKPGVGEEPYPSHEPVATAEADVSELVLSLVALVAEKNEAYGNSAKNSGAILASLYPDGVRPDQYTDMLLVVRILDKLSRIATDKDALGENPFMDIAGYGLVGVLHV